MLTGANPRESWWGGWLVVLLLFGWLRLRVLAAEKLRAIIETSAWETPAAFLGRLQRRAITAAGFSLAVLARLLEGEAAMLWALVLLSLMVSLFVQLGLGT
jgi:hypothetical protein